MPIAPSRTTLRLLVALLATLGCESGTAPDTTPQNIALTTPATTVGPGATLQLAATVRTRSNKPLPDLELEWESTNPSVATVSATGLVTGVTPGTTTIRVTHEDILASVGMTVAVNFCTVASASGNVVLGTAFSGNINVDDCILHSEVRAEGRALVLPSPDTILFRITGTGTSSSLHASIMDVTGDSAIVGLLSTESDSIRLVLPMPAGTFRVWVASDTGKTLAFSLLATPASICSPASVTGPITVGAALNSSLNSSSCYSHFNHTEAALYTFALDTATAVRFDLRATGFPPFLMIRDAAQDPIISATPLTSDSTSIVEVLPAGSYSIMVSSLDGGVGAYSLRRTNATLTSCNNPPADSIALGETVNGHLSVSDCSLAMGLHGDVYAFTLADTSTVRIDLTSAQINSQLLLRREDNSHVASDDNSGGALNSRLTLTLPPGNYRIVATSYASVPAGDYSLSVQLVP